MTVPKYDGTSTVVPKYDGTSLSQKDRKERRYCSTTLQVGRYFNIAKSTTVPKYDGTSTTVLVRRYYEYYGTPLKCSCSEVR